jgi:hypothetical protein
MKTTPYFRICASSFPIALILFMICPPVYYCLGDTRRTCSSEDARKPFGFCSYSFSDDISTCTVKGYEYCEYAGMSVVPILVLMLVDLIVQRFHSLSQTCNRLEAINRIISCTSDKTDIYYYLNPKFSTLSASEHGAIIWALFLIALIGPPLSCHGSGIRDLLQANVQVCVFVCFATLLYYYRLNFYRASKAWHESKSNGIVLVTLLRFDTVIIYIFLLILQQIVFCFSIWLIFPFFIWSNECPVYEKWGCDCDWFVLELVKRYWYPSKGNNASRLQRLPETDLFIANDWGIDETNSVSSTA